LCPFPQYFKLFVLNYGFVVLRVFHLTGSDVIWREKVSLWGLMMSLSTGSDITMVSLTLTEHAQCHGEHASPWLPTTPLKASDIPKMLILCWTSDMIGAQTFKVLVHENPQVSDFNLFIGSFRVGLGDFFSVSGL
jgi:hypothetical protein